MNIHPLLESSLFYRKLWKAGEILLVLGLRGVSRLTRRPAKLKTEDRRILDEVILPEFVQKEERARVLFVGCDWYTQHYESMFAGHDYWTLERDPERARFGSARHLVAGLGDLDLHTPAGSFDLIVCNGVIGWGLDDPGEIEEAMAACVRTLAPLGVLLIGWNDVPERTPIPLDQIEALRALHPYRGRIGSELRSETYNRHSFLLLEKPERPSGPPPRPQPNRLAPA